MKTDQLEQFVRDHREEFDDMVPDPALWNKIRPEEVKTFRLNWKTIGLRAAAVVIIFISSYYFHDLVDDRQQLRMVANEASENNAVFQNLIEAEMYYTTQINYKKEELFKQTSAHLDLRDMVLNDLTDLDKVLLELKADLGDNAANGAVVDAMIQNYRLKLSILEDILSQLQTTEEDENDKVKTVHM